MKLAAMRYKGYVWPHNPRTYTIDYQRNVAVQKVPFGRYHLQDLGLTRRVMRGEGEFVGEGADDEFNTVEAGETLWGIARDYGLSLTALIEKNPQIKNPNLILVGERVRVA